MNIIIRPTKPIKIYDTETKKISVLTYKSFDKMVKNELIAGMTKDNTCYNCNLNGDYKVGSFVYSIRNEFIFIYSINSGVLKCYKSNYYKDGYCALAILGRGNLYVDIVVGDPDKYDYSVIPENINNSILILKYENFVDIDFDKVVLKLRLLEN